MSKKSEAVEEVVKEHHVEGLCTKKDNGKIPMDYICWSDEYLDKCPVIDHTFIGRSVRWSYDPYNYKVILRKIMPKGSKGFPNGGYIIKDPSVPYLRSVNLNEVVPFVEKAHLRSVKRYGK